MQITFFSFIMSLLWFNIYIVIINSFRKKDKFITSFSTFPLMFFMFLSIFRFIFNLEIPGVIVIGSKSIFTKIYDFLRLPLEFGIIYIETYQLLLFIWISVAVILLIDDIIKYRKFKRSLEKLEDGKTQENQKFFQEILEKNKVKDKIEIVQNSNISSPFILGILKGRIYIPNIDLSKEEFEYIILHEINHFKGRDSLKKIFIQSIKYIFWWNPLSHLFADNFNQILEIQCDLKTTTKLSKEEKVKYLESITKIIKSEIQSDDEDKVRGLSYDNVPGFAQIEELQALKQRFRIVLKHKDKRNLFTASSVGLCILGLILTIASYFFIIQPQYSPNAEDGVFIKGGNMEVDSSFILEKENGSYDIYVDNTFKYNIKSLEDLDEKLDSLPIFKESIEENKK